MPRVEAALFRGHAPAPLAGGAPERRSRSVGFVGAVAVSCSGDGDGDDDNEPHQVMFTAVAAASGRPPLPPTLTVVAAAPAAAPPDDEDVEPELEPWELEEKQALDDLQARVYSEARSQGSSGR